MAAICVDCRREGEQYKTKLEAATQANETHHKEITQMQADMERLAGAIDPNPQVSFFVFFSGLSDIPGPPLFSLTVQLLDSRVATNRKSQVVPDLDIRWKKGGPHSKGGPYEVEKKWPGAATGGPRPARQ